MALISIACAEGDREIASIRDRQREGRYAETIEPLRTLLERDPSNALLNRLYGEALLKTGEAGSAVWPLERAAASPEHAVEGNLLLASAFLQGNSPEEALRAIDVVLEVDPGNEAAVNLRIMALLKANLHEEALVQIDEVLDERPEDYVLMARRLVPLIRLGRVEEVEQGLDDIRAKLLDAEVADPESMAYFCATAATFRQESGDSERANEEWETCLHDFPESEPVFWGAIGHFAAAGEGERLLVVLRDALARDPENLRVRTALSDVLRRRGQSAEAEALLLEGTQLPGARAESFQALADSYVELGEFGPACDALEASFERMEAVPDRLRLAHADLLIQAGRLEDARAAIDRVEQGTYKTLLEGRMQLAEGQPAKALALLDEGLVTWPDNAGARYLAGRAAAQLGDFPLAVSHYREAIRIDPAASDAPEALAELFLATSQPGKVVELFRQMMASQPDTPERLRLMVRAGHALGDPKISEAALTRLEKLPGQRASALAEAARVTRAVGGAERAKGLIESTNVDLTRPANQAVLLLQAENLIELDSLDEALRLVESAVDVSPEDGRLLGLRGRVRLAGGDRTSARTDFERALELGPTDGEAMQGLAKLALDEGEPERALAWLDRSSDSDPEDARPALEAVRVLEAGGGDRAEIRARMREVIRRHPHEAVAAEWLARDAFDTGDATNAERYARQSLALGADSEIAILLARVLTEGDPEEAVFLLRRVLQREPERSDASYWLGRALLRQGREAEARSAFAKAAEGPPFAEAERARQELTRLESGSE